MKICEILASTGEGGLEKHTIDLCNGMAELGHDVHVIASDYFKDRFCEAVKVYPVNMQRSRHNIVLLYQLFTLLQGIRPDVIHAQANKATSLLARIKPLLRQPCIGTIHNKKSKPKMFQSMDAVIGVSQGALSVVNNSKCRCIYNGVHAHQAVSSVKALLDHRTERPIAITIARLVEAKRVDVLIQAWRGIDADLVILGDGPLRVALEQQVDDLSLGDRIHFSGFVPNASHYLSDADVMIISSDREGFPYVMVEALIAHTPVISTNVDAAVEAIPESMRVMRGDSLKLNEKITDFFTNRSNYTQDLDQVFDWASQELTVDNMVRSTISFLEEVQR